MRSSVLLSLLAATANAQLPGFGSAALGPFTAAMGLGGKVGGGGISRVVHEQASGDPSLGSRRVKIRYGPYEIPGKNRGAIGKMMDGEGGMLWNMPDRNVQKPCTDCMLTYIVAGLENMEGQSVNTAQGLWLHHMVTINKGHGLKDATCEDNPMSLPHIDVGASPRNSERFFASGNERTITDMTIRNANIGYYVARDDNFNFIVELMNMNEGSKKVYMTITWEYVPGVPSGFSNTRPVWLDVFQCGLSDVEPKKQDGAFDSKARTWHANFNGRLMGMGGHLHDGGIYLDIIQNGRRLCRAVATYNNPSMSMRKRWTDPLAGMISRWTSTDDSTQRRDSTNHISAISYCGATPEHDLGRMSVGDRWDITGHYDYSEHPGMLRTDGKQSDIMAIAVMMVAIPMNSNRRR